MNYLLTETQLSVIVESNKKDDIKNNLKNIVLFGKKIVHNTKEKFDLDFKLLATWGAAIGGMAIPLDNYIRTNNFNITDDQISLILIGVISTLFFDNKRFLNEIKEKIQEEGLYSVYLDVLNKGEQLKNVFIEFMFSLTRSFNNIVSLVRYSFLIPIITDLHSIANNTTELSESVSHIVSRIIHAGILTVSSESLTKVIRLILKRFKQ